MKKAMLSLFALCYGAGMILAPSPAGAMTPSASLSCSADLGEKHVVKGMLPILGISRQVALTCANDASAQFDFFSDSMGFAAIAWMGLGGIDKWIGETIHVPSINGDFRHEQEYKHGGPDGARVWYEVY